MEDIAMHGWYRSLIIQRFGEHSVCETFGMFGYVRCRVLITGRCLQTAQVIECLRPRVYGAGDFIIYEGDEGSHVQHRAAHRRAPTESLHGLAVPKVIPNDPMDGPPPTNEEM